MDGTKLVAYLALAIAVIAAGFIWTRTPTLKSEPLDIRILREGKIKVGVVSAPPITGIDPNSRQPHGYAVDIIRELAQRAKIDLEFTPTNWNIMGAALSSSKADLIIGPIYMTEGRAREFAFTDPLFAYSIVAIVPKNSQKVSTLEQLQTPGLRIAVGRGGFDAEFVRSLMPQAQKTEFPSDDPTLSALEVVAGRTDVALMDLATAKWFVAGHPEVDIRFEDTPVSLQYAAFMLRREDTALRDFLNLALRNLELSGGMSAIDATYAAEKTWYGRVRLTLPLVK
jgi:ABC-type amino acid transport substrate-binding protein